MLIPIATFFGALAWLHKRGFRDGAFSDPILFLTGISLLAYVITQPKRTSVPVAVAICSLLIMFAFPAGLASSTEQREMRELQRGLNAYHAKDFSNAAVAFSDAIQINPRSLDALCGRGLSYICLESYEQAISDFDRALAIDPNCSSAFRGRGAAFLESGNDDEAIRDLSEAIRLEPNDFEAYYNRGVAYHFRGDQTEALTDLEACTERGGSVPEALMADVRRALGQEAELQD